MVKVQYHYADVSGQSLFYREAGPAGAPTVVLLHGSPSSSFMFRNLIPLIADEFHVIAPDLLGFGFSAAPPVDEFVYTFAALSGLIEKLMEQLRIARCAMYVHDIGAPVGWRLALAQPERITAIISQSGNAYAEGFVGSTWADPHAYDADPTKEVDSYEVSLEAIKQQYLAGAPDPTLVDPDTWWRDFTLMTRPGNDLIQLKLLRDYGHNIRMYPRVQRYFRESQVPLLAIWGRDGLIFGPPGARAFRKDLPNARIELLPGGHFLLETAVDEAAEIIRRFLQSIPSEQWDARAGGMSRTDTYDQL